MFAFHHNTVQRVIYTVSQKGSIKRMAITLLNLNRFSNSCIDKKRRKFAKQRLEKNLPHLIYDATLPWASLKFKIAQMNYANRMILTQTKRLLSHG